MRGLILGFDGVLVDEQPVHAEVLHQVLADEGLEVSTERVLNLLRGEALAARDPLAVQRALQEFGASDPGLAPRLAARKAAFYQMRLRSEGHRSIVGASELIERAHDAGWMLGLLSATPEPEVESALQQLGVRGHFKTLAAGVEPTATAYQDIWRDLNSLPPLPSRLLHPHEVLALDSAPAALEAAAAAGLVVYGMTTRHPKAAFEAAEKTIENLGDLLADF